jgi:hypothetical protein
MKLTEKPSKWTSLDKILPVTNASGCYSFYQSGEGSFEIGIKSHNKLIINMFSS